MAMNYEVAVKTAGDLLKESAELSISWGAAKGIERLQLLLSGYTASVEIRRLQRFIAGDGEVPEFDQDVAGMESEIQAAAIVMGIWSVVTEYGEDIMPGPFRVAYDAVKDEISSKDVRRWQERILQLVDQERSIIHRMTSVLAPGY